MMSRAWKKRIAFGAVCLLVTMCVSGCRNSGMQSAEEAEGGRQTASGSKTMGRYMETIYEMPKEMNRNGGLNWLEDGSLSIIDFNNGLYRSSDGGETWKKEEAPWYSLIEQVYCRSAVMGPDGTVAASCSGELPGEAEEIYSGALKQGQEGNWCVFAMPDGTMKVTDFGWTADGENGIERFVFKEDGRLFAGDWSGKVYEVDPEKESLKELFMAEHAVGYMDFSGETLMAVGADRLYLYDLEKEVMLPQDATVDAFIGQMLEDGIVSYTGGGFPLAVMGSGEENVIYIGCRNGMYRHVLGGSAMEQVIDGGLSTFGDSYASIYRMKVLGDQEFLVAFNPSSGLVRYIFNEDIPSMPDKELQIYSLKENRSVRQAVTVYKKLHTDIYVRYEVGVESDSGMTEEDALKRLNTRILAGDGPDVLILDDLPFETYMEKGMLRDIRPVLDSLDEEDALFANIVDGFVQEDGAVYAMPMGIRVPLLVGDREAIAGMEDLEGIAQGMEQIRRANPEGSILWIQDPETMLRLFGMVSSTAWIDENGQMDAEAVSGFLNLVKSIYDTELEGAIPEQTEALKAQEEELASWGTDVVAGRLQASNNVLNIASGFAGLAGGYVEGIQLELDNITSVLRTDERLDYRIFNGQGQNLFFPEAMAGISSGTDRPQEAESFVRLMFGRDVQEHVYSGYPVNRAAYEACFSMLEENSSNGTMTMQTADGTEQDLELYWPDRAERQRFTAYVETLETPVLTSGYLCGLVYEEGVGVLKGETSAEDAAAEIIKKAGIYLAE